MKKCIHKLLIWLKRRINSKPPSAHVWVKEPYIEKYLETEKWTLNFLKPFVLFFFGIDSGIMAYLYQFSKDKKVLISIFAIGLFFALFLLWYSISKYIRSIYAPTLSTRKFISLRTCGKRLLIYSIAICLITFELALVYFVLTDLDIVNILINIIK